MFIYTLEPFAIAGSPADGDYISDMPTAEEGLTDDYTQLTNVLNGHAYFLGLIESETTPGKIGRAFVCGIEDDIPFCLEGGIDEYEEENKPTYDANEKVLNAVFSSSNMLRNNAYTYWHSTGIYAHADDEGYVDTHDSTGICSVDFDGYIGCSEELPSGMPGYSD